MNLNKSLEYFNPSDITERIHIIGCGSVGSTVVEELARLGLTKFSLYDFDKVEAKNIANQMFVHSDIGKLKTEAVKERILAINPEANAELIKTFNEGWNGERLTGYVFLCVDSIEVRRQIVEKFMGSTQIKAMFDFRTRLEDAQHYAADWSSPQSKENFLGNMDFSHDEAVDSTPKSACGGVLGVNPTVHAVVSHGVANFVNFTKGKGLYPIVLVNPFTGMTTVA